MGNCPHRWTTIGGRHAGLPLPVAWPVARRAFLRGALALAAASASGGLAACWPKPGPAGRLVVALGTDPATLDPLLQTGLIEASVYGNVFDPLLGLDEHGRLVPALAESYRAIDERTWEFRLRRGVVFHNGEPFDAASVRATVERMLDPASKSPVRAQLGAIERVETPDPHTAVIVTRRPFAPLLAELTGLMMLPPRALAEAGPDGFGRRPVGTGPFRFVEWIRDDHLTLEANEAHWRGAPSARRLEFRPIPDGASRVAALIAGQVDLVAGVPVHLAPSLNRPGLQLVERPGIQTLYVRLNARKPPLDDARVRRALALAVNVEQLLEAAYGGHARRVNGPYPPEVFGYDASVPSLAHDLQRARALLREAGLGSGLRLVFETPRGRYPGDDQVPEMLAGAWGEIGARVEVRSVEWSTYLAKLQAGQGEHLFLLAGTNRTFDPHFTIVRLYASASPFGLHYYGNPQVDALADEAAATPEAERRRTLYARILATLRDDVPAIWIAQLNDLYGLSSRLTWTPRADSLLWMYPAGLA